MAVPLLKSRARDTHENVKAIILHYSAGYNLKTCADALASRGVSAHAMIERDGEIVELVPYYRVAYHVKPAHPWGLLPDVNACSVGTEIINFGPLDGVWEGTEGTERGQYDPGSSEVAADPKERVWYRSETYGATTTACLTRQTAVDCGGRLWAEYTPVQIKAVAEWAGFVADKYDVLPEYILGHEHVQGNKTDPGPAFPWDEFWKALQLSSLVFASDHRNHREKERIASVQSNLRRIGHVVTVDGVWGPKTQAAIDAANLGHIAPRDYPAYHKALVKRPRAVGVS
jgi:N-acetylmuramoyl-L-alanine amidase